MIEESFRGNSSNRLEISIYLWYDTSCLAIGGVKNGRIKDRSYRCFCIDLHCLEGKIEKSTKYVAIAFFVVALLLNMI